MARRVALRTGDTLIGRAPSCDVVFNVNSVSRQHARITVTGDGRCVLADAGSRFGTILNGAPVVGRAELMVGNVFQCGQIALSIEQAVEAADLLSEAHQMLEDSGTLIRRLDPAGARVGASASDDVQDESGAPDARPAIDRRSGTERRVANMPYARTDRRSGHERRHARLLRLLSEIGKTLISVQPLPQMLARVVDLVFDVVPAERAFLLLRDSSDQALTARILRNRDGSAPAQPTLSRTVVNKVMRERVAMLAADARYDSRLDGAGSIQAMNIRSFMCAPLWNRNEVIGVLYADNPRTKRFLTEDLDVFTALAAYAAVAIEQARLSEQLLQETKRRERLQRYHSPGVVNRILHGGTGTDAPFLMQHRDVTVMFCDLVSFTTLSEAMEPYQVAQVLNQFFTKMADVIFEYEGTLDKFIGDAILAVFGAPFEQADHVDRAVEAAITMQRALEEMNRESGARRMQMRIAVHSGTAMTGDIGSPKRRDFTVLGDVVNIASRMGSSIAKPGQIVISRETLGRLKRKVNATSLGQVGLWGKQTEVEVFEVVVGP
ncbi:MAG: GAF domain-containing protein [Acidobacteria bacterium]|nr:GAF domain-containing protein [Acidobacteriota bacterium]